MQEIVDETPQLVLETVPTNEGIETPVLSSNFRKDTKLALVKSIYLCPPLLNPMERSVHCFQTKLVSVISLTRLHCIWT